MSDVTIEFEDDTDALINKTITFSCVDYDWSLDRGISVFPLKILKVFSQFFNALLGDYPIPPVLITDFGSTIEKFTLRVVIDEGTTDASEAKAVEYSKDLRSRSFIADRTYLRIGDNIVSAWPDFIVWAGKGREGKIGKVDFKWKGERYRFLEMTIEFVPGVELDFF